MGVIILTSHNIAKTVTKKNMLNVVWLIVMAALIM